MSSICPVCNQIVPFGQSMNFGYQLAVQSIHEENAKLREQLQSLQQAVSDFIVEYEIPASDHVKDILAGLPNNPHEENSNA